MGSALQSKAVARRGDRGGPGMAYRCETVIQLVFRQNVPGHSPLRIVDGRSGALCMSQRRCVGLGPQRRKVNARGLVERAVSIDQFVQAQGYCA